MKYYATRDFNVGRTFYGRGSEVPAVESGAPSESGIRPQQVVDLERMGYITTEPASQLETVPPGPAEEVEETSKPRRSRK